MAELWGSTELALSPPFLFLRAARLTQTVVGFLRLISLLKDQELPRSVSTGHGLLLLRSALRIGLKSVS